MSVAGVAQPVERHLAKVEVASSSLVTRSIKKEGLPFGRPSFFMEKDIREARRYKSKSPVDSCLIPSNRNQHLTHYPKGNAASSLVTCSGKENLPGLL